MGTKGRSERARYLTEAIMRKLQANEEVLEQSLEHGRVSWRIDSAGRVIIKLEPMI